MVIVYRLMDNASTINFEAGAIMHFTDKLNAGFHVYNPVGGKLGKDNEMKNWLQLIKGLGYDASENFLSVQKL